MSCCVLTSLCKGIPHGIVLCGFLECCSSLSFNDSWNKPSLWHMSLRWYWICKPSIRLVYLIGAISMGLCSYKPKNIRFGSIGVVVHKVFTPFSCGHIAQARNSTTSPRTGKWSCHVVSMVFHQSLLSLVTFFYLQNSESGSSHELPDTPKFADRIHSPASGCDLGQQGFRCCPQCARAHCCALARV